jgi:predicted nucleotidyltransferase
MERTIISAELIKAFCQKHPIRSLVFFGSVIRDDFKPESEIDVLGFDVLAGNHRRGG